MSLEPAQKAWLGPIAQTVGLIVVLGSAFHWSGRVAEQMTALAQSQAGVLADQRSNASAIASVVNSVERLAIRVEYLERDNNGHQVSERVQNERISRLENGRK